MGLGLRARHDLLGPRFEGAAAEAQLGAQEASDQQPLAPPPVREPRDPCCEHARGQAEEDLARLRAGVRFGLGLELGLGSGLGLGFGFGSRLGLGLG